MNGRYSSLDRGSCERKIWIEDRGCWAEKLALDKGTEKDSKRK